MPCSYSAHIENYAVFSQYFGLAIKQQPYFIFFLLNTFQLILPDLAKWEHQRPKWKSQNDWHHDLTMIRRPPNSHFLCGKARKGCFNDAKHLIGFSQETGRACKGCWMHHFPCIGVSAQWNMLTSEWQWTRAFEASSGKIHQLTILRNRLRSEIQLFCTTEFCK